MKNPATATRLLVAITLLALASCATNTATTNTNARENLLVAAGFKATLATTPQQQAHLQSLPAGKITPVIRGGSTYYILADPAKNELLVGTAGQYEYYQQLKKERNAAIEDETVARMQADTSTPAQWALWGSPLFPQ